MDNRLLPRLMLFETLLATFVYFLMEWLFFITKPSFLSGTGWHEAFSVLFLSPAPWVIVFVFPSLLLMIAAQYAGVSFMARLATFFRVFPAVILAACFFLLVDNFSYSLFACGVLTLNGPWRLAYALLYLGLVFNAYRMLSQLEPRLVASYGLCRSLIVVWLLLMVFFALTRFPVLTPTAQPLITEL